MAPHKSNTIRLLNIYRKCSFELLARIEDYRLGDIPVDTDTTIVVVVDDNTTLPRDTVSFRVEDTAIGEGTVHYAVVETGIFAGGTALAVHEDTKPDEYHKAVEVNSDC